MVRGNKEALCAICCKMSWTVLFSNDFVSPFISIDDWTRYTLWKVIWVILPILPFPVILVYCLFCFLKWKTLVLLLHFLEKGIEIISITVLFKSQDNVNKCLCQSTENNFSIVSSLFSLQMQHLWVCRTKLCACHIITSSEGIVRTNVIYSILVSLTSDPSPLTVYPWQPLMCVKSGCAYWSHLWQLAKGWLT